MVAECMTLGSLFSGSGSFELAGIMSGIKPLWLSEIEPYPLLVTHSRLPDVKQYGDIRKLDGAKLPPVDIITGGFPCTDVSISGKRTGLHAARTGLFFDLVRIVKEMREATHGQYPRYLVAENVPGLFSSNRGEDFRTVLEEICRIKDEKLSVPGSEKWAGAGEILGDGFSIAWRVLDAQYWGVPQRRRRIYLVADLTGERAGKILFESEGVPGYPEQSRSQRQKASRSAEKSTREAGVCLNDQGGIRMDVTEDVTSTLRAQAHHPPCVIDKTKVYENHSQDTRYTELDNIAPTVLSTYGTGGNNQPFVVNAYDIRLTSDGTRNARANIYKTDTARTIDTGTPTPERNQGGIAIVGSARNSYREEKVSPTIDTNGAKPTCNQAGVTVVESFTQDAYSKYSENDIGASLMAKGGMYGGGSETLVYSTSKSSLHTKAEENKSGTLVATDYKDPPTVSAESCYTVRRLTPTECARLQGLPDTWCKGLDIQDPSDDDLSYWKNVWNEWCGLNGKKPKSVNLIRKWLSDPYTDSAEYKLYGNGIALPCARFVLSAIVYNAQDKGR